MNAWQLYEQEDLDNPEFLLNHNQEITQLREQIQRLHPLQRQVIECQYIMGICRNDVAKKLNITPRQVSHHRHEALSLLRKTLR